MLSLETHSGILGVSSWQWMVLGLVWLVGVMVADVTNPQSWLKRRWRWQMRYCDVKLHGYVVSMEDGDECQSLVAQLTFVRDVSNATISLHIAGILKSGVAMQSETIVIDRGVNALKGEKRSVCIFRDRNSRDPENSYRAWTDRPDRRSLRVVGSSKNVVTISISAWRTQRYRIYVQSLTPRTPGFPPFFYMGEDFDALETAQGPVAP